ncbi:MAG: hypothetical protein HUU21_25150 [Polyangiaceae bacterium]|nr:hypothetical protein [Polyangiaceae bacterium]
MREARDPIGKALLAAAILHAASIAAARFFPAPEPPPAAVDIVKGDLFDIELSPSAPALPPSPPPGEPAPAPIDEPEEQAERPPSHAAGAARAKIAPSFKSIEPNSPPIRPDSAPPPAGIPGEPGAPNQSGEIAGTPAMPSPSGGSDNEFSPPEGPGGGNGVITGLNGQPIWAMPGVLPQAPAPAAAPTTPTAPKPVDRNIAGHVISGTLRKKDQEIGLDLPAGGVVATTIAAAVRSSATPNDARATFEVRLGADGKVLSTRVVSATAGDAGQWEGVAKKAAADLASRPLTMSGDAAEKGAVVTVKIESKVVYPAGSKEKYDIQPVCAEEVIQQALEAIAEGGVGGEPPRGPIRDPAMNRPDPGKSSGVLNAEDEDRKRRFCIPIGIAGKGDISNIGAHTQRVVRSSFQVTVPGSKPLIDVKKVDTRAPWSPPDPNKVQRIKKKWPKKKKKRPSN